MLLVTFSMVCQDFNDPAVANAAPVALVDHARQFSPQRGEAGDAAVHLLEMVDRDAVDFVT